RPAFSDPDGDALVFTAAGLPSGVTMNAGMITGTAPSVAAEQTYNVTATASDGRGRTIADACAPRISPPSRADIYVSGIGATPAPAAVNAPVDIVVQYGNAGPTASGNGVLTVTLAGTAFTLTESPCAVTASGDRQTLTCDVTPVAAGGTS